MKIEPKILKNIVIGIVIIIAIPLIVKIKHGTFSRKVENKQIVIPNTSTQSNTITKELVNKGLTLIRVGKYEESLAVNLKALQKAPNNAVINNNIGFAYANLKQWDKSLIYLSKAIEINPSFKLALNNYNWVLSEKKKSQK